MRWPSIALCGTVLAAGLNLGFASSRTVGPGSHASVVQAADDLKGPFEPWPSAIPGLEAPPNAPAEVDLNGATVSLRYHRTTIFEGRVRNASALREVNRTVSRHGGAVDQVVVFTARGGEPLELAGTVAASAQAFAAESERGVRALPVVRHSSGPSRSLLNQAVYDRKWDWVLSIDDQPRTSTRVTPSGEGPEGRRFAVEALGREIVLRFRPRFYQQHRGLSAFEPWTYDIWPRPVVGWCSWFAFFDAVTEQDVKRTADVLDEVLRPFGYEYLQIDDGYQRSTGLPDLWLAANEKFPGGLAALAGYIRSKGLVPGIWTNATFSQTEFARQHPDWFVRDASGAVVRGNWIDHPVDATVPEALEALVRPIYRGLRGMGWEYYKLDALRHLRYEGYNTHREHFAGKGREPGEALRAYVEAVRGEVGRDRFLLACWGVRPELAGLVDGCRLGTDGFSYAGLAQFNSFNNVVWRNDPDHIELSDEEAWRSTMVTSLTGSLFMLTDRPERYRTPVVEAAKRAAPVLVTAPGQLYDVDPSRSSQLWRVDGEVSGRDPKPFDAGLTTAVHLYLLEVNRPFESWVVLGRTGGPDGEIRFEQLGLDPARQYVVFDYFPRRYRGSFATSLSPGAVPSAFNAQVLIIREQLPRPQLLATGRHLTGGGVDLLDLQWHDDALEGRSQLVAKDPYELFLTEPAGWTVEAVECGEARTLPVVRENAAVRTGCATASGGELTWRVRYRHTVNPRAVRQGAAAERGLQPPRPGGRIEG